MKNICPICEGSGQLRSFKGVSRFLLSWEECPECGGLGYIPTGEKNNSQKAHNEKLAAKDKKNRKSRGEKT